tara:strand:- start:1637 stop:2482 length:846 start_codon:yes stop_codon:yes gene_type:complete
MAIPYLHGYSIKPTAVSSDGQVMFTDGTNIITPNQQQCEAYGYTYNQATGTCNAFAFSTTLGRNVINETNKLQGSGNVVETGTNNTTIVGENNTVKGLSRNNIIIGSNNQISHGVDNANVYGTLAQATADNSIVLGCNAGADILGERQNITLMYGKQTTNNSTVDAFLNNTTDSYFVVPDNAVVYFQSETIAVRVAGSSGSGAVGDFKSWVERGVVKNARGTLSIARSRTSPASSGTTTGWSPINSVSGTNFLQTVKGATDMTIEWASTIRITQIQTSVEL